MLSYSVLMSIYRGANPDWFRQAVDSMLCQTVPTDDFVIVCDGALTPELENILAALDAVHPGLFRFVRLKKNVGIGAAANEGLKYCKNDLVAKMDGDDIALPRRCQLQLERFSANPGLTILGGQIAEFENSPEEPFAIRAVPLTNDAIRKFSRRRQAFNNMTVMYRRRDVMAVGGYRNLRRSEDYDLYLRLLMAGCQGENLEDVLVFARVNQSARSRRASWQTFRGCVRSRWYALRCGFSSFWDFLVCLAGAFVIFVCPGRFQQFLYRHFLRRPTRGRTSDPQTAEIHQSVQ